MKLCVEQVPTSRRQSWLIGVLDVGGIYSRVHCYVALVQNLTSARMHDEAERWLKDG